MGITKQPNIQDWVLWRMLEYGALASGALMTFLSGLRVLLGNTQEYRDQIEKKQMITLASGRC